MQFFAPLRRAVTAVVYPKRLPLFDRLNANADFRSFARLARGTATCFSERSELYQWLNKRVGGQAIDYLEFGVSAGASIKLWSEINIHPQSRFFGFDTFTGLPENWTKPKPTGAFSCNGRVPEMRDERVTFVKGLFQSTLYPFFEHFVPMNRLVINIDCDLYSAALFSLTALDRFIRSDTVIVFDEFYDARNEFAAFQTYKRACYRELHPIAFTTGMCQMAFEIA